MTKKYKAADQEDASQGNDEDADAEQSSPSLQSIHQLKEEFERGKSLALFSSFTHNPILQGSVVYFDDCVFVGALDDQNALYQKGTGLYLFKYKAFT